MQKLAFLAIGSELLSGHVLESNSHWLQKELRSTELEVQSVSTISDDMSTMVAEIKRLMHSNDILMICGGLGPTDDDLTRNALAEATNDELIFSDPAWQDIQTYFQEKGKKTHKSCRRQAYYPKKGESLRNSYGTAPGLKANYQSCSIYAFPGVPSEFKGMSKDHFLPNYQKEVVKEDQFKLWGIGESKLTDLINDQNIIPKDLFWGTIASKDGITIKFPSESRQHPDYNTCLQNIRTQLKAYIYSEQKITPLELLVNSLKQRNLTVSTAESCTGGLLSSWLTSFPGSSSYFIGTTVAYQNNVKIETLGVPQSLIEQHGAISEDCAKAMSQGALKLYQSDLAISVTGIAGPSGGSKEKPVGTVCLAASLNNKDKTVQYCFSGNRDDIREKSCYAGLLLAHQLIHQT